MENTSTFWGPGPFRSPIKFKCIDSSRPDRNLNLDRQRVENRVTRKVSGVLDGERLSGLHQGGVSDLDPPLSRVPESCRPSLYNPDSGRVRPGPFRCGGRH